MQQNEQKSNYLSYSFLFLLFLQAATLPSRHASRVHTIIVQSSLPLPPSSFLTPLVSRRVGWLAGGQQPHEQMSGAASSPKSKCEKAQSPRNPKATCRANDQIGINPPSSCPLEDRECSRSIPSTPTRPPSPDESVSEEDCRSKCEVQQIPMHRLLPPFLSLPARSLATVDRYRDALFKERMDGRMHACVGLFPTQKRFARAGRDLEQH